MDEILNFITKHYQFIVIPFGSALIGWITNILAIKMTFYPINYFGLRPFGWQGIIPSKAPSMAVKAVDLMTDKLLDVKEVFSRVDPKKVSENLEKSILQISKQIINEVMKSQIPIIWNRISDEKKQKLYNKVSENLPFTIENTMQDVKENVDKLIDFNKITYDALIEDKTLVNRIFLNVGKNEFRFIEISGLYFGFLFGAAQAFVVYNYNQFWIYLIGGLIVGYLTNFLAIKLIFKPTKKINLGIIKIQGLFLKRQKEVAAEYSKIITQNIVTVEKLYDSIFKNHHSNNIKPLIKKNFDSMLDEIIDNSNKSLKIIFPKTKLEYMKNIAIFRFLEEIPIALRDTFEYSKKQLDLENTLRTKMASLPSEDFISFLRPVFQEDEYKLIIVGAALGCFAGFLQSLV